MTRLGENPRRLPKRFYGAAAADDDKCLRLDGKIAKTRGGKPLVAASSQLGAAIADEWNAQVEFVDFSVMPLTRFAMTVVDLGEDDAEGWRSVLGSFLASDLLCYRALEPAALVARQTEAWDPLLGWASSELGINLKLASGVSHVQQSESAIAAGEKVFAAADVATLLGMKSAAEISGSAIISLALANNAFPTDRLFDASRVDERFQAERWGIDAESMARESRLKTDFFDVARFLDLL